MGRLIALGIGAGLVSALLFGVVATGNPAAILLGYLAPLPILIVSLGWHNRLGLLAVFVGAAAVSVFVRQAAGIAFALGPGLPAWWLATLVLTGRRWRSPQAEGIAWLPPGYALFGAGLAGAFVATAAAWGVGNGDATAFEESLRRVTERLLRLEMDMPRDGVMAPVAGVPGPTFVNLLVTAAPVVAAAAFALALAANLWLGAKSAALSGRLPRPWVPVPESRMPTMALAALAGGIVLALLPGWSGLAGRAIAGGLGMMFAVQGLALLHVATRGRPGRAFMLGLAYILTLFFGGTVVPLMAVAGMIDTATPLRARLGGGRPPSA